MGFLVDIVLPAALAFIMFALGLDLTLADFARVAKRPRDFLVGAVSQIAALPLIAWLLISAWDLPPALAFGVMILAAAPGGVTSNILTAFARGDVALSISLTAVVSLLGLLTIPIVLAFFHARLMGGGGAISVSGIALSVFAIVTVPVLLGMAARHCAAAIAIRFRPTSRRISAVLFVLVVAGAIYQERAHILPYFAAAGPIMLVLNLAMMTFAYLLALVFASGGPQRVAISIECGLQNGTLAIAVATLAFGGGATTIPAAVYSLIMFGTALLYIARLRRTAAS